MAFNTNSTLQHVQSISVASDHRGTLLFPWQQLPVGGAYWKPHGLAWEWDRHFAQVYHL